MKSRRSFPGTLLDLDRPPMDHVHKRLRLGGPGRHAHAASGDAPHSTAACVDRSGSVRSSASASQGPHAWRGAHCVQRARLQNVHQFYTHAQRQHATGRGCFRPASWKLLENIRQLSAPPSSSRRVNTPPPPPPPPFFFFFFFFLKKKKKSRPGRSVGRLPPNRARGRFRASLERPVNRCAHRASRYQAG